MFQKSKVESRLNLQSQQIYVFPTWRGFSRALKDKEELLVRQFAGLSEWISGCQKFFFGK